MDYFNKLNRQVRLVLIATLLLNNVIMFAAYSIMLENRVPAQLTVALMFGTALLVMFVLGPLIGVFVMQPLKALWRSILNVSPGSHEYVIPKSSASWLGRDMVELLTGRIYRLGDIANTAEAAKNKPVVQELQHNIIAANLPLPLLVTDAKMTVTFANVTMLNYIGKPAGEVIGQYLYNVLDLTFPSISTFGNWLEEAEENTVTAVRIWERVRLNRGDKSPLFLDMAAYYNKDNPEHVETIVVLFDHTELYTKDEQDLGFVALAVHELRTPLTLLRGYIEVFEQELQGKLDPEMDGFVRKMHASAQQLAALINTMLQVARVESDQLELQLEEGQWSDIVTQLTDELQLRAGVRGITLHTQVDPGLPTVGVDRTTITEVLTNLIDNAIKYSGQSKKIDVNVSLSKDGLIETTVQDYGVGIPESVVPQLFSKFKRNHRNRATVNGTGLGLYLSKAIVGAHGGNIWIRSHENEGTTVGFTLLPFARVAAEQKAAADNGIARHSHGWIKNHSMYRR